MNVTPLIRPLDRLGLYFRPGRNDHKQISKVIAGAGVPFTGAVLDATLVARHADLLLELRQAKIESVLDPMALELATPAGWARAGLRELPWAGDEQHSPKAFKSNVGRLVDPIGEYAVKHDYSAVIAPSHYLEHGAEDDWWRVDHSASQRLRQQLDAAGKRTTPIFYRLAVSRRILVDPVHRRALSEKLATLDIDALWLCIHPVGVNASGSVVKSYMQFCEALRDVGVPVVAERTGSLGLALLGFNAVGGIEAGLTLGEGFDATRLAKPPAKREDGQGFSLAPRVYVERLNAFLSRKDAKEFFSKTGTRRRFGCQDRPCCKSPEDTIREPRRHFLHIRARELAELVRIPSHNRPAVFLETVRRASDDATYAARINDKFKNLQQRLGDWRETLAGIVERKEFPRNIVGVRGGRYERRRSA